MRSRNWLPFASTWVHPRMFGWVRVADLFKFVFSSIMCLHVLSSVLWCPFIFRHTNDVPLIFTPSCMLKGACFIVNCTHVHRNTERPQISKKNNISDSVLPKSQSSSLGRRLHLSDDCMSSWPLASSVPPSSDFAYSATEKYFEDWFYFLWIIVIAYCITYNVSILMNLTFRILLILKRLLLLALPLPWSVPIPNYSILSVFESLIMWYPPALRRVNCYRIYVAMNMN